jgi:general secretion pathway protein C
MNSAPSKRAEPDHRSRLVSLINVVGLVGIAGAITWKGELMLQSWWNRDKPSQSPSTPVHAAELAEKPAPSAPIVVPKGNDSSISPVPLKLVLVHTQAGRTPHEGYAQIGVVRETPQTYLAGAILVNGARLIEIYPDRVRLEKDGHSAWLHLQGKWSWGKTEDGDLLRIGGDTSPKSAAHITSREALTDYIRPSPVYDGGTLLGYQVYSGRNAGPFVQMGLQTGDVIVAINGTPLAEPNSAWEALRALMSGGLFDAVILRRGNQERLTLDGSLLVQAEEARNDPLPSVPPVAP